MRSQELRIRVIQSQRPGLSWRPQVRRRRCGGWDSNPAEPLRATACEAASFAGSTPPAGSTILGSNATPPAGSRTAQSSPHSPPDQICRRTPTNDVPQRAAWRRPLAWHSTVILAGADQAFTLDIPSLVESRPGRPRSGRSGAVPESRPDIPLAVTGVTVSVKLRTCRGRTRLLAPTAQKIARIIESTTASGADLPRLEHRPPGRRRTRRRARRSGR